MPPAVPNRSATLAEMPIHNQSNIEADSDAILVTRGQFDAALFDLDGVVTNTASVHAATWEGTFNDFLERRARKDGREIARFTLQDYWRYLDGQPRYSGIRRFLAARGIEIPEGSPSDDGDSNTVYGLGARKNTLFRDHLQRNGVEVFAGTIELITRLHALGVRTGLVTASRNGAEILRAANLDSLFEVTIDGHDRQALGLRGKPSPDTFVEAARKLGVLPSRTVVIEDATAGVEAGRAGGFGLVIGVDRVGRREALLAHGADVVVQDLSLVAVVEPDVDGRTLPSAANETVTAADVTDSPDPWVIVYDDFDPAVEGRRETLLALGNGYLVTRGAAAESRADDVHYPGTYLAGGYNRLTSTIDGRSVEHEDLVNLPNWLPLTFRIDDGDWLDLRRADILAYRQSLDLRQGLYERRVTVRDARGRETTVVERRFVHMRERHLAGQHVVIIARNWTGRLTVRALLDGRVTNGGVLRYRPFEDAHVRAHATSAPDIETVMLEAETSQSQLRVALAARFRVTTPERDGPVERQVVQEEARVGQDLILDLAAGERVEVEKVVAIHTSRDRASADSATDAWTTLARAGSFEELLSSHALAWVQLWDRCDLDTVEIDADASHRTHLIVRLHVFHLLQTVSPHVIELDVGVPARGWHGEGYRGHIFWDELFIFPFLVLRLPVLARALLLYRYRRLPEARWAARAAGYLGAMFPWQSGSTGREETDLMYLNPRSGRWLRDDTHLQRHVGAAIAFNVWRYYQATGDTEFLYAYGAEMVLEIGRFWASIAQWNDARGRYDIPGVLGPDEFHDRYPGRKTPGLDNNTYTNVMASWCLARALEIFEVLPAERGRELRETLGIGEEELERWDDVSRKLFLPIHDDGIPSQFEGYEALAEFDWEEYRRRYGNIRRLDLILESEKDSPNHYKAAKQADVLMLFYLFSADELEELFARLDYAFDRASIPETIDYYLKRTSEGSTLSGVVHAWVLARSARQRSWPLFTEALRSDIDDIQGGTTAEGIHLGAMAGTVDMLQRCYTGLELRGDCLRFRPALPDELRRLSFQLRYRRHTLSIDLTPTTLTVASDSSATEAVTLVVRDETIVLSPGTTRSVALVRE